MTDQDSKPLRVAPLSGAPAPTAWRWLALMLLVAAIVLVPAAYRAIHNGRIYPGVKIAGHDVGGRSPAEALAALSAVGIDPRAPVEIGTGDQHWQLKPDEVGVQFDARASVAEAYAVGRRGGGPAALLEALAARITGHPIRLQVQVDGPRVRQAVERLAAQYDRPAQNAALVLDGTVVRPTEAHAGRYIQLDESVARLAGLAQAGSWPITISDLPAGTIAPTVTDAGAAVSTAQAILAAPITLEGPRDNSAGGKPLGWSLEPAVLAPMLTPSADGERLALGIDVARFAAWLEPATAAISRTAQLPRFHFDPATRALTLTRPGAAGYSVDISGTAQAILKVGQGAERRVAIAVHTRPPLVADDASAESLGIRELVRSETSRYAGSPPERIYNVYLGSSQFDGLLIPPDGIFSFNDNVGDISEKAGYKKSKIILDGATAQGVGGGMCQVSTTLFRVAFWLGLPILERQAHGYRVAYYEQGSPPGLDATVFGPSVDLKFKNDTGAWLLIETISSPRGTALTFRVYGTKPDRQIKLVGPVISNPVPAPAPRTEVDVTLPPGKTDQVEFARAGASVSVTRIITDAQGERKEAFNSRYRPTGALVMIGPNPEAPAAPPEGGAPNGAPSETAAAPPPGGQPSVP